VEKIGDSASISEPSAAIPSCCSSKKEAETPSCCGGEKPETQHWFKKTSEGIRYTFSQLYSDILGWLVGGLIFAALVQTFLSPTFLAEWGSGLPAMIVMVLIGVPMYVCATASTPIAAGLILAGISPGTALVFLMAGPATNIATLGIIGKELGKRSLGAYLSAVIITALAAGLILDYFVDTLNIDIQAQLSASHEMLPEWLAWASIFILVSVGINSLFKR